MKNQCH